MPCATVLNEPGNAVPDPTLASGHPPPERCDRLALVELVLLDLEHRLRAGEPAQPEDYFARYPELRKNPETARRLQSLRLACTPAARGAPVIAICCTGCKKKLSVKEDLSGKKVKCPGCGQVIAVAVAVAAGSSSEDLQTLLPSPVGSPNPAEPDASNAQRVRRRTASKVRARAPTRLSGAIPA